MWKGGEEERRKGERKRKRKRGMEGRYKCRGRGREREREAEAEWHLVPLADRRRRRLGVGCALPRPPALAPGALAPCVLHHGESNRGLAEVSTDTFDGERDDSFNKVQLSTKTYR